MELKKKRKNAIVLVCEKKEFETISPEFNDIKP